MLDNLLTLLCPVSASSDKLSAVQLIPDWNTIGPGYQFWSHISVMCAAKQSLREYEEELLKLVARLVTMEDYDRWFGLYTQADHLLEDSWGRFSKLYGELSYGEIDIDNDKYQKARAEYLWASDKKNKCRHALRTIVRSLL